MNKKDSLRFASASAAIKCMHKGPRSKATVEKVKQFINFAR